MAREAEFGPDFEAYLEQNEQDRLAREAGFDFDDDYRELQAENDYRESLAEEEALYMQQIEDDRAEEEAANYHYQDEEEDDEDMEYGMTEPLTRETEFAGVEVVLPRRSYRGAANIETVKDCEHPGLRSGRPEIDLCSGNFLGSRADKVCCGSDDGNFFVWDKETGGLEGIWEGDGSVVNGR